MADTESTLPGNGTAGPFNYTFPALEAAHVKVSVDNVAKTVGVDYSLDFVQKEITFLVAPYPTAAQTIRIYRETGDAALEATFYSGAAIRATDLNNNFNQALYVAQETKNLTIQASTGNLADGSITNNLLATNAVSADKIGSNAVTTAKLADNSVTTAKLSQSYLTTADASSTYQTQAGMSSYLAQSGGTMTGNIVFSGAQAFPKIPANPQTQAYTLVANDSGKHISITTGGVTVPAGVFVSGDVISIYNDSTSSQTITEGASVTLRQAGTTNTGNRTLNQYGVATLLCVASNVFVISGVGLI